MQFLPKINIIILNWNGYRDTAECLESLKQIDYPNYEIVLVDNGSSDGSPDRLKKEFPYITLIKNTENLGFAEGNNVGIRYALNRGFDYILLLNNDTVVDEAFLKELVAAAERDEKVGLVVPLIYYYADRGRIWFAGGFFRPILHKTYHRGLNELDRGQYQKIEEVPWGSGCCLLINKDVINKIGLLDKIYFNNYEDVDFCMRAKRAGFKVIYIPRSKIWHKFAASVGGKYSPFYTYFRARNNLLFLKKEGKWGALVLNLLIFPFFNLRNLNAVFSAIFDFLRGRYGRGPF